VPAERRPTLRQEQQAETRRRLLSAARDAFLESGFTATTVERIVEAANTSRATFYLHFKNKTEALLSTWSEVDRPEVEGLFRAYDEAGDFSPAGARAWAETVVSYFENHGLVGRTALQALALEPELEHVWIAGMARTADTMPRYVAALGGGEPARAIALANVIQVERVLYFWSNDGLPMERADLIAALGRTWAVG